MDTLVSLQQIKSCPDVFFLPGFYGLGLDFSLTICGRTTAEGLFKKRGCKEMPG